MNTVTKWEDNAIVGAKRAVIEQSNWTEDWFVGRGKDDACILEGTWWDMVCLARNILSSKNTRDACPEFYHPEMKVDHWVEDGPYRVIKNG